MYRDLESRGLSILAIDVSNDRERTRAFYEQYGFTIPAGFDVGQEVASRLFGVSGTPTNYLLDARGRIVWRQDGYRPGDEVTLRHQVEAVLAAAIP